MKTRAAVSTIVGTLIMLGAAGLFSGILMFWSLGMQGQSQTNVASATYRSNQQASEMFFIEDVLFESNATGSFVRLYIRNGGTVPVQIKSVFVTNLASGLLLCNKELATGKVITSKAADFITVTLKHNSDPTLDCPPKNPTIASLLGPPAVTVNIRVASLGGNQIDGNYKVCVCPDF